GLAGAVVCEEKREELVPMLRDADTPSILARPAPPHVLEGHVVPSTRVRDEKFERHADGGTRLCVEGGRNDGSPAHAPLHGEGTRGRIAIAIRRGVPNA